ncbi:tyrosine-type recombinase/integrase [Rhizobium beringeri]
MNPKMSPSLDPQAATARRGLTQIQGQYLAFIYAYSRIFKQPPAEADMRRHFGVTAPSVHQMVLTLEKAGFISRVPGAARSIQLLIHQKPCQFYDKTNRHNLCGVVLAAEDLRHQVPSAEALGRNLLKRRIPHIYTPDEISALLQAAARLKPSDTIRPLMYETLFGLLATTGMRISEALALRLEDVTADGLVIRQTKFQKSRLLPLHDTTRDALDKYLLARRRLGTLNSMLFVSAMGAPAYSTVIAVFLRLARSLGLGGEPGANRPPAFTILRHTFAVRSLDQCQPDHHAVGRHIVALSTYLGHAHVTDTYWYLQATPILLRQIAAAGEALHQGAVT